MKILANDGISINGIEILESKGFEVITTKVAQNQLENYINENNIDAIVVKNTTQVRQELIEECPSIKLIGCANLNMDNIDADYARDNGVHVVNTPTAVSNAIGELVFAHLFGIARFLHQANRDMPLEGDSRFNTLKKHYAKGTELRGKTIGIIGFGNIGQEVAKIALGIGMKVIATDTTVEKAIINIPFFNGQSTNIEIETSSFDEVLKQSDFITLHLSNQEDYILEETQFNKMKDGVGIINTAQGNLINEVALVNAIESGKVKYAGLDVFENEPTPAVQLLMNPEISLTPHIAASTIETEEKAGTELANQIIKLLSE
ncbi:NAD(P)-dependent oxidoreductase [uncultured Tenacibaculum sp.]|uniref:NAD(P)-dependent oxidoreductase n=1 Tax=uncultured Tenacibaculum sp. TaxID=174713 RepID=UPI00262AEFCC|nr:NAD(P)-dependent oxidoreductase [uncultured Tenacibaculum sp.]